jgi:Tir chaperone family protein CesT
MVTREDILSYLDRVEGGTVETTEVEPGLWRARTQSGADVVVHYAPPVVILRMRVMEPPASDEKRSGLYRQLLEFNARDLVHGSYGLEGEHVVLTDALELADLDYTEFEASWDSLTLALASHLSALAPYRER